MNDLPLPSIETLSQMGSTLAPFTRNAIFEKMPNVLRCVAKRLAEKPDDLDATFAVTSDTEARQLVDALHQFVAVNLPADTPADAVKRTAEQAIDNIGMIETLIRTLTSPGGAATAAIMAGIPPPAAAKSTKTAKTAKPKGGAAAFVPPTSSTLPDFVAAATTTTGADAGAGTGAKATANTGAGTTAPAAATKRGGRRRGNKSDRTKTV
jgi:hypothetical protein